LSRASAACSPLNSSSRTVLSFPEQSPSVIMWCRVFRSTGPRGDSERTSTWMRVQIQMPLTTNTGASFQTMPVRVFSISLFSWVSVNLPA
jgi:hypothetical protein